VSKILANRSKKKNIYIYIYTDIISESQSAFQVNKVISDNILVAFETLHHMKTKKMGKCGFMVKLDMTKVYDRVEWNFMVKLMEKMGF